MPITFSFRPTGTDIPKMYHGSYSRTPLKISGAFYASGMQIAREPNQVPNCVVDIFEALPDVTQVALSTATGGAVWARPQPDQELLKD